MSAPDPRFHVVSLVFGHMAAQTVAAAVRLGVADRLGDDPVPAAELAAALDTDPPSTLRLLRALTALGLLTDHGADGFTLTPAGAQLRSDDPTSMHAFVSMFTDPAMTAAWARLDDAVRTGSTMFDEVLGVPFFTHLERHPELSALFNASMSQGTAATAAVLPTAVDFARFATLADLGGGDGTLLAAVLAAHPDLHGILFDSAAGLSEAPGVLGRAGVTARCELVTGDFFVAVPAAEAYLLKSIVHDWDDDRVVTILAHCRQQLPAHGRVLVVEPVLPDVASAPSLPYLSDLNMLVNVGGRERTAAEFATVARRAGFAVAGSARLPAPSGFWVIELAPEG